jgi:hypothetical protein
MKHWPMSRAALTGLAIGFVILLPITHWMTIPAMPWILVFKIDGISCGAMAPILIIFGWMQDRAYLRHIGREMLKKLES